MENKNIHHDTQYGKDFFYTTNEKSSAINDFWRNKVNC